MSSCFSTCQFNVGAYLFPATLCSERTVASYMRAVLRTLAQCHAQHILHRDIKPGESGKAAMGAAWLPAAAASSRWQPFSHPTTPCGPFIPFAQATSCC